MNNIKLRKLVMEDAPLMLEWMQDEELVAFLHADFLNMKLYECEKFIERSWSDPVNKHFAVIEDNEYMGTVSLKNIGEAYAEFAICMRRYALGRGIAIEGMRMILNYGFAQWKLNGIYWCVSPENKRAVKFYDKNQYERLLILSSEDKVREKISRSGYSTEEIQKYIWFMEKRK